MQAPPRLHPRPLAGSRTSSRRHGVVAARAAPEAIAAWAGVAIVAIVASTTALSSFTSARSSIDRIESGRKTTARKQQDRKKLARKLWGLGSVDEEEEQDEGKKR